MNKFDKGGVLEAGQEYKSVRYEIWNDSPNGYYIVPVDLESTLIFSFKQPSFDNIEGAKEYAEIEINGYLEHEKEKEKVEFKEGGKIQLLKSCPSGTSIVEILLNKSHFPTERSAKTWGWRHSHKHANIESKENYFHLKQDDKSKYRKDSFRTIDLSDDGNIKAIVGCPKSSVKSKLKK